MNQQELSEIKSTIAKKWFEEFKEFCQIYVDEDSYLPGDIIQKFTEHVLPSYDFSLERLKSELGTTNSFEAAMIAIQIYEDEACQEYDFEEFGNTSLDVLYKLYETIFDSSKLFYEYITKLDEEAFKKQEEEL